MPERERTRRSRTKKIRRKIGRLKKITIKQSN
jgi:hypothetical protein